MKVNIGPNLNEMWVYSFSGNLRKFSEDNCALRYNINAAMICIGDELKMKLRKPEKNIFHTVQTGLVWFAEESYQSLCTYVSQYGIHKEKVTMWGGHLFFCICMHRITSIKNKELKDLLSILYFYIHQK